MDRPLRVIGLTGGIATGKSTVARFFAEQGVPVIDADQLARAAVLPGSHGLQQLVDVFGSTIIAADGTLKRTRLRELVFADSALRNQLEGILHPIIKSLAEECLATAAQAGHSRVIYMAPLLIEAGAVERVDTVWVVTLRPEIQLERLMRRDGINETQARSIIASQMPLAEKERYGNVVIDNSGTEAETLTILAEVWSAENRSIIND